MSLRFHKGPAAALAEAIRTAGGVEVFAIGDVVAGVVTDLVVTCRGLPDRVPALLERPRAGQVVIHNHPSGNLLPSEADLALAARYGDDGIGVVIVDSEVTRSNWVVEPWVPASSPLDASRVQRFFREDLAAVIPGYELREEQVAMALGVASSLSNDTPYVCEAGTGTGKSLAYLIPAALWALENDSKVVISTYTRALQAQLVGSDLPMLIAAGLPVRIATLQGRSNYLCKRRLSLALQEENGSDDQTALEALAAWSDTTDSGRRADVGLDVHPLVWERVESDSDLTLRLRCPHYENCHYYEARRSAAGAHLIIVNHALLLADLALKDMGLQGVIPSYDRIVLDEAHHLEEAATGAISKRLTYRAIARAIAPLLSRRRRRGALERLVLAATQPRSGSEPPVTGERAERLRELASAASDQLQTLRTEARVLLEDLADSALSAEQPTLRITRGLEHSPRWRDELEPPLQALIAVLGEGLAPLSQILKELDGVRLPENRVQPLFDVRRAERRFGGFLEVLHGFGEHDHDTCRWLEGQRSRRGPPTARLVMAPIDVSATLRRILWHRIAGTTSTSATMTIAGRFGHWMTRTGLREAEEALFPSPFDHAQQALLALPRDLPVPDAPGWLGRSIDVTIDAVRLSEGGTFVLCTSYQAVEAYANALRGALPASWPVLVQTRGGERGLVEAFRRHPNSVLVGTDSFWEGVSVKGWGLRQVIIPRLPFRVPTDPLQAARHERAAQNGQDPFRTFTLPQAVLKLRQGYGRLIRSRQDRGVVLILDRRMHDRSYGAIMLRSLPPARRIKAPWRVLRNQLRTFWASAAQIG